MEKRRRCISRTGARAIDVKRRTILTALLVAGAVSASPALIGRPGFRKNALAATSHLTLDTLNGVAVFFVPGPDPYSVQQGESTPEPGALEAGAGGGLFQGLNFADPFTPDLANIVAELLNDAALAVSPTVSGPFRSPFANLSFEHKALVFAALEGDQDAAPIVGILPVVVGFLTYGETAVFDPVTRTIVGRPIGWDLSNYSGVSDGREELRGYFRNRRKAVA